jgi:hypothetical protein
MVKKGSKQTYDEFLAQARSAYDEAAGGPSWWDNIACAWDDAKCRTGSRWQKVLQGMHLTHHVSR